MHEPDDFKYQPWGSPTLNEIHDSPAGRVMACVTGGGAGEGGGDGGFNGGLGGGTGGGGASPHR